VKLAIQLAIRHKKLSAAISDMSMTNASHTLFACSRSRGQTVDQILHAILSATEQATAATTAVKYDQMRDAPLAQISAIRSEKAGRIS